MKEFMKDDLNDIHRLASEIYHLIEYAELEVDLTYILDSLTVTRCDLIELKDYLLELKEAYNED